MPLAKEKVLKLAKGFRGRGKNIITVARRKVDRALAAATAHRKAKHREQRKIWIMNINAACRENGMKYNHFMWGLELAQISLNRKSLSELARNEPYSFKAVLDQVKRAIFQDAPPKNVQVRYLIEAQRSQEERAKAGQAILAKTSTTEKLD
eukprot:TRINITY_DN2920_c0_g1_i2.p1 TRINITY_DN2920_c0_g1~~TRINITY_DN2920_c0_g1_i2.p1  ORF type:complete len:151 (-),score=26.12 TRINITY_DN2920_c0_g1_i2:140-592(-)